MTTELAPAPSQQGGESLRELGEALAAARCARGLSVEDLARQLKYATRQILALERGELEKLPGGPFVRGMVRSYAHRVGLDVESLLAPVADRLAVPGPGREAVSLRRPIPFSDRSRRMTLAYATLSLAALVLAATLLWDRYPDSIGEPTFVRPADPPPAALGQAAGGGAALAFAAPEPAPAAQPPAKPAPAGERRRIALRFERESWVEVREAGGAVLLSQLNPAGTERVVEGTPPFELVIGNARHVRVAYGDRPIDLAPHIRVEVARLRLE